MICILEVSGESPRPPLPVWETMVWSASKVQRRSKHSPVAHLPRQYDEASLGCYEVHNTLDFGVGNAVAAARDSGISLLGHNGVRRSVCQEPKAALSTRNSMRSRIT